ncbi:hypothetical protein BDQ17DRAFT_1409070 [Cyathus striatus]|nr:hypothetical protein BDQ17DRAFT_1409070 [Cyathus striatus]
MPSVPNMSDDPILIAGPLLLGYLLNWGLYGVLSVQVYVYYLAFPNDRLYSKIPVYFVFLLESVQSILIAHDAFKAYAKGFDKYAALINQYFTWLTMPIIGGIGAKTYTSRMKYLMVFFYLAALIVQLFYAYRISLLKSRKPAMLIVVLAIMQCASAITAGVLASKEPNLTDLTSLRVRIIQGIWAGMSTGCDVLIAICMSYQLTKRESVFPSTQAFVARILRLIIGTGSLTAAVAILNLVLFNISGIGPVFLAPGALLGKLYSNSMMVILNSRIDMSGGRHRNQTLGIMGRPSVLHESTFATPGQASDKGLGIELSEDYFNPTADWNISGTESSELRNAPKHIEIGVTSQTTIVTS